MLMFYARFQTDLRKNSKKSKWWKKPNLKNKKKVNHKYMKSQ